MKQSTLTLIILASLFAQSKADIKSDILSLTGNARTILVWDRYPWCDEDYKPIQAYSTDNDLGNNGPHTQLLVFDTDQGKERFLDSTIGSHFIPRLTRKDGSHVIWTDRTNKVAWIRDCAGLAPKRQLLSGTDFLVGACHWNPTTNEEEVYVISDDNLKLYAIPLKAGYTADVANRRQIYQSNDKFDRGRVSLSRDAQYFGTSLPWPNPCIVKVSNGQRSGRRYPSGAFGCEANLAPDDSYRFFHLGDEHDEIYMWPEALGTPYSTINLMSGVPWPGAPLANGGDCTHPRWTNSVRFFTAGFPLMKGYEVNWDKIDIFGMSAASVKADNPSKAGFFCLGKFSADYKSVEKYVRVSDGDIRHREVTGDAWVALSTVAAGPTGAVSRETNLAPLIALSARIMVVSMPSGVNGTIAITNTAGRTVARAPIAGTARIDLSRSPAGLYVATCAAGSQTHTTRLVVR